MNSDEQQPEGLIHEREAAQLLGLSMSNLRSRRARRLAPEWVRIGGRVLYQPSVLSAFIKASAVQLPAGKDTQEAAAQPVL